MYITFKNKLHPAKCQPPKSKRVTEVKTSLQYVRRRSVSENAPFLKLSTDNSCSSRDPIYCLEELIQSDSSLCCFEDDFYGARQKTQRSPRLPIQWQQSTACTWTPKPVTAGHRQNMQRLSVSIAKITVPVVDPTTSELFALVNLLRRTSKFDFHNELSP